MNVEGCIACDLADGRLPLPGGRVHETPRWLVEHCIGPLGVGTLIVKPRRHIVHVADLDDKEATELGPLLRTIAAIVTDLTDPEQVYVTLWSHADAVQTALASKLTDELTTMYQGLAPTVAQREREAL